MQAEMLEQAREWERRQRRSPEVVAQRDWEDRHEALLQAEKMRGAEELALVRPWASGGRVGSRA